MNITQKAIAVRPDVKWYKIDFREQVQARHKYKRLLRQFGLDVHRQMFKHQVTVINTCLHQTKHHYYSNKGAEAASNQQKPYYDIVHTRVVGYSQNMLFHELCLKYSGTTFKKKVLTVAGFW